MTLTTKPKYSNSPVDTVVCEEALIGGHPRSLLDDTVVVAAVPSSMRRFQGARGSVARTDDDATINPHCSHLSEAQGRVTPPLHATAAAGVGACVQGRIRSADPMS